MIRKIVYIDEEKCNGCGLCIQSCAEGAIKLIDGKARLVDDRFCDGLGACLNHCPQGAITIIEREAEEFDEEAVRMHLKANPSCPGSMMMDFRTNNTQYTPQNHSKLRQWPVQLALVSPEAPYFKDAELLVSADCVPFAYSRFHSDFLKGKSLVIGCPKLDDAGFYTQKLTMILKKNNIKNITLVHMEVPCCFGLERIVEDALHNSGRSIPISRNVITIKGDVVWDA